MFFFDDFFDDPLDDLFAPRYYYRRQPTYVDRYYDAINDRLNQVLAEEFGLVPRRSYPRIDIQARARQLERQRMLDALDHSQVKEKIADEVEEDAKKAEAAAPKPKPRPRPHPFQSLFYESRSTFDGKNYVEEHRERVTDPEGKVHQTTRRRLGDRWYEAESITDNEGKTSTKETWHNVPEDQIEKFKSEWAEKHDQKYSLTHDEKPAETKPEEAKPEEKKTEEAPQ